MTTGSKSSIVNGVELRFRNSSFESASNDSTYKVLLGVKSKLQELKMSEQFARKAVARRPPVPCPELPRVLGSKQSKTGNYSYADIEFRPLIITEHGAISAPIETQCEDEDSYDSVGVKSPTDNYEWDDDVGMYGNQEYASVELNVKNSADTATFDSEIPLPGDNADSFVNIGQMRETVIGDIDDTYRGSSQPLSHDTDSESKIYDTPIDSFSQKEVDVSQLYASVDFTKKKKNRNKDQEKNILADTVVSKDISFECHGSRQSQRDTTMDVGKSKFFIDIPDRREGPPPPIPKPFTGKNSKFFELPLRFPSETGRVVTISFRDEK